MTQARRPRAKRRRGLIAAGSLAGHALAVLAIVSAQPEPPVREEDPPIQVVLYTPPPPPPPEPPPPPPQPEPDPAPPKPAAKAPEPKPPKPPPRRLSRPARAPPTVAPILAIAGKTSTGESNVSDAELAGAQTAGSGGGGSGRACNMARWLEGKLRKDRTVQAALAGTDSGKAIRVWNGSWVRHGEQEGAGLAAVRESIMWHVAFAPEACRAEPVRGLVAISMRDGPGSPRVVMGASTWRWSDLLHSRSRGG